VKRRTTLEMERQNVDSVTSMTPSVRDGIVDFEAWAEEGAEGVETEGQAEGEEEVVDKGAVTRSKVCLCILRNWRALAGLLTPPCPLPQPHPWLALPRRVRQLFVRLALFQYMCGSAMQFVALPKMLLVVIGKGRTSEAAASHA
jgi:hypothetical protein